jgi:hypothetical protein
LAAANRLLPSLALPGGEPDPTAIDAAASDEAGVVVPAAAPYDPVADAIQQALAELLAERQSRDALRYADRDLLVPHVWLVADIDSPETADLAPWLARLRRRLAELRVEARLYLLVRNRSWGRSPDAQAAVIDRVRRLTEDALAPAGHDPAIAFVLSDRDAIGGLYSDDETTALAHRLADLILLGDVARGATRAFTASLGGGSGGWETQPVFGSAAGVALRWDAPAAFRASAERRRQRLLAALEEPAPPTFEPPYPALGRVALAATARWPALDLPSWSPRFWKPAPAEYARARDGVDRWLVRAGRWRHEMLVIHEDRHANLDLQADAMRRAYVADLDAQARIILEDESLPGFFSPLARLTERAAADMRVRRRDLRPEPPTPPLPEPFDAAQALSEPEPLVGAADDPLARALERKINPLLLLQVVVVTFALAWVWVARVVNDLALTLVGALVRWLTTLDGILPADIRETLRALLDWRPVDPSRVWLWSGLAIGTPLLALAVATALRQRVVLERAYRAFYQQAATWRDAGATLLPAHLIQTERTLDRANVDAAEAEIVSRRARLDALRQAARDPVAPPEDDDPALGDRLLPAKAPPPPLTDLQVAQIGSAFRRGQAADPGLHTLPGQLLDELYRTAAHIAGDPEPDLRLEAPRLRRHLVAAMPPDGAVRAPQPDTTAPAEVSPPPVARFFAVPEQVAADLRLDGPDATAVAIPVDDRFAAIVVQSGMSARRILALPAPPPEPPSTAPDEPDDDFSIGPPAESAAFTLPADHDAEPVGVGDAQPAETMGD